MKSIQMVDDVVGLTPGQVAERHFELLLDGTSIRGEEIIEALRDYLVKGVPLTEAWKKHDLNPSQFYRRLKVIQTESTRAHALSAYYQSSAEGHHVPRIRSKVAAEAVKSAESKAAPKPSKAAPKASKAAPKAATKTAAKATETAKGRKAAD
jgi:hypothetical protein